jgi:hypothetical protein
MTPWFLASKRLARVSRLDRFVSRRTPLNEARDAVRLLIEREPNYHREN